MKTICKKSIVISIILLLLGIGIHPAFAVDTKTSMVNKASEEDCGCNEIDDRQLVVLEKQIDRLEMYSKLLLVLSKHHSEVLEDYEVITDMISTLKTLDLKEQICNTILELLWYFVYKTVYYLDLHNWHWNNYHIVRALIYQQIYLLYGALSFGFYLLYRYLDCEHNF